MMFWQVVLKTAYEILALPLTIRVVAWVKKIEGVDTYDEDITYNIFHLSLKG